MSNLGTSPVRLHVIPPLRKGDDEILDDYYAVVESRPLTSAGSEWKPVYDDRMDNRTIFPQRAVVDPDKSLEVLFRIWKLPAQTRGHEFRVALHDESDAIGYSEAFDALGRSKSAPAAQ